MNYQQALKLLELKDPPLPEDIKQSFRRLALKHHPDRNPDDPHAVIRFRECTEAYNYLVVNVGHWRTRNVETSRRDAATVVPSVEDLDNIFDDIFGFTHDDRMLGFQDPQDLFLSLPELFHGASKEARLYAFEKCSSCKGSGAEEHTHATICTYCFGSGQIKISSNDGEDRKVCPKCFGRGRCARQPCLVCDGFGRIRRLKRQEISVPAGLIPGQVYTLGSRDVKLGKDYSLFVYPRLKPHPLFQVESSDVLCEYPLSRSRAKQGGEIDFPALSGWSRIKIPPNSQSGNIIRLKGEGLKKNAAKNEQGDLCIRLLVVPDKKCRKKVHNFLKIISKDNPAYGKKKSFNWYRFFFR